MLKVQYEIGDGRINPDVLYYDGDDTLPKWWESDPLRMANAREYVGELKERLDKLPVGLTLGEITYRSTCGIYFDTAWVSLVARFANENESN